MPMVGIWQTDVCPRSASLQYPDMQFAVTMLHYASGSEKTGSKSDPERINLIKSRWESGRVSADRRDCTIYWSIEHWRITCGGAGNIRAHLRPSLSSLSRALGDASFGSQPVHFPRERIERLMASWAFAVAVQCMAERSKVAKDSLATRATVRGHSITLFLYYEPPFNPPLSHTVTLLNTPSANYYCIVLLAVGCRRRLSSSVTLPADCPAGRRVRGRSGGRHNTASQSYYVPLGRHLGDYSLTFVTNTLAATSNFDRS